jgi:hypothetical protein
MANNTYQNQWNPATNWNVILNALPKNERRLYKLVHIAQVERQKVGTPSYRRLNYYIGTVSPVIGHPWGTAPIVPTTMETEITELSVTSSAPGNFQIAHGLTDTITAIFIKPVSSGEIWLQTPEYDGTYIYLTASDADISVNVIIFHS